MENQEKNIPVELGTDALGKIGGGISTTYTVEDKELKTLTISTEDISLDRPVPTLGDITEA